MTVLGFIGLVVTITRSASVYFYLYYIFIYIIYLFRTDHQSNLSSWRSKGHLQPGRWNGPRD